MANSLFPRLALVAPVLLAGCYNTNTVLDRSDAGDSERGDASEPVDGAPARVDAAEPIRDSGWATTDGPVDAWHPSPRDGGPPGDRGGDVWEGYVESYMFVSGSDHVRIQFDSATGDGPRTGFVVFGMGTAPPPATDPTVGYPPGADLTRSRGRDLIAEGLEYPIVDGSVVGDRVRLTVHQGALWETWCELQSPVLISEASGTYGCLPDGGGAMSSDGCSYMPGGASAFSIDCGRMMLCMPPGVCACTADECSAAEVRAIAFDFHVSGTNGDGSVMLEGLHNVHLTR